MSIVRLNSVTKRYGALEVLKSVSMEVERGTVVSIIGRSGSGKSTLLRCMNGLESIQAGEIVINGMKVCRDEGSLRALRQEVGFVFQSYNLFPHFTVERNITIGLTVVQKKPKDEAKEIAERVLRQVGLVEKLRAYPDELSGGQQQRVAIARCLALSPKLMLFDEVTSALDPELKEEVLRVIADLAAEGMTMILVTHEMQFARSVSTEIMFMNQGKVWESGSPAKIFGGDTETPELRQFVKSHVF